MDTTGSLLERLRQQLANVESTQRRSGGIATAGFWSTPSPDAAEPSGAASAPTVDAAHPGPEDSPGHAGAGATEPGRSGSFPWPFALSWPVFTAVPGRLAPTFAFAAGTTTLPGLPSTALGEADLFECVTQLGRVQHHKEVNLVRLVGEVEARGVASPGGLSRADWLRSVDPTLTAASAKAVLTCATAFNQPRWQQLRVAVTGETAEGSQGSQGSDGDDGQVTVGKAAQVIDFFHRLKPVADPDDLDQAVAHLAGQAAGLRWEQLAKLARELSDQVRHPTNTDEHDQNRRDGRGLWFTPPDAAGMVGMSGTLDPEGAAIIKAAIDPLSAPCPLTDEAGGKIEDDPRRPTNAGLTPCSTWSPAASHHRVRRRARTRRRSWSRWTSTPYATGLSTAAHPTGSTAAAVRARPVRTGVARA
ncbi:MAG: DUF222 domain-containing protein [Terracoccus sp.]